MTEETTPTREEFEAMRQAKEAGVAEIQRLERQVRVLSHLLESKKTLRDEFASDALRALVQKAPLLDRDGMHGPKFDDSGLEQFRADMAASAYAYADHMLAERQRLIETPGFRILRIVFAGEWPHRTFAHIEDAERKPVCAGQWIKSGTFEVLRLRVAEGDIQ